MIHFNEWEPDTCGCKIEFSWDDAVPETDRVHTLTRVIGKCDAHAAVPDDATHYATLNDENTRKNLLHGHIFDTFPALRETAANGAQRLKEGVVDWSFDDKRVLHVTIKGLTPAQRTVIQALASTKQGAGRIAIT